MSETSDRSGLVGKEMDAIREAIGFRLAGETDNLSVSQDAALRSAERKVYAAPPRAHWLPFSQKELELLWLVLGNGAPEHGSTLGMRSDERRIFAAAANRIAAAGKLGGPRFSE